VSSAKVVISGPSTGSSHPQPLRHMARLVADPLPFLATTRPVLDR
jgi:hypothetical protein